MKEYKSLTLTFFSERKIVLDLQKRKVLMFQSSWESIMRNKLLQKIC